ncbi:MAG: type II secretion system F family protein [Deltaproteobacteria bacterium]|nr:type II secretion system F family protein [Deltaproteobacteria bacterium]
MNEIAIYIVVGIAILLAAEAVYFMVRYRGERQRANLKRKLNQLGDASSVSLLKEHRIADSRRMERWLSKLSFVRALEKLILQTDLSWTVASMLAYSLLIGFSLGMVGILLIPHLVAVVVCLVLFGLSLPFFIVLSERSKRGRKISTQLPDALDMMARSLRAGHGTAAAFKLVATEMAPPIAVEFGRCFEENRVGVDFREAVSRMTQRVPRNMDLKLFAVSLIIQNETGGNLIEILEKISSTVRERFKFYGKLRALTAEVKASGFVLALLPFLFTVVIMTMNPKYLVPLMEEPLGRFIVAAAILLWIVGVVSINRLSKLDL